MNARAPLSRGQEGVYTLEAEGRTVTRKEVRVSVLCEFHFHLLSFLLQRSIL